MYGKAKVGRPDWYMMGACIVFALTFSLRSVPLAVLLLLFMPFSLLSLTGELPLPTRNAPICQTLLCISIPLLVIGAFPLCCSSCRSCSFRPPASGSSAAR